MKNESFDRGIPGWLVLLGILTAVAPITTDMYLPGFPEMESTLGSSSGTAEFTLASFFIGVTLGQLFYGPVSDRFGRKSSLYFGFTLYTLASIGCVLSTNFESFTLFRFLQGMGGCAGIVISRAIVRDRTSARDTARAFSLLMLVMGVAPILAPMMGGWFLTLWGWRSIFIALVVFGVLSLCGIFFMLTESHDISHEEPLKLSSVLKKYSYLMRNRAFLGYTFATAFSMAGMFAYIAGSPFVFIELYGIQPQHYGWIFGFNALGLIVSSQLNARLLRIYPATTILRHALQIPVIVGISLVCLALVDKISLPFLIVGFFIFVSSVGWISPNATASALATHGQMAGTASALVGAFQYFFATIAGFLVGALHNHSAMPIILVMALCASAGWIFHRTLVRH